MLIHPQPLPHLIPQTLYQTECLESEILHWDLYRYNNIHFNFTSTCSISSSKKVPVNFKYFKFIVLPLSFKSLGQSKRCPVFMSSETFKGLNYSIGNSVHDLKVIVWTFYMAQSGCHIKKCQVYSHWSKYYQQICQLSTNRSLLHRKSPKSH